MYPCYETLHEIIMRISWSLWFIIGNLNTNNCIFPAILCGNIDPTGLRPTSPTIRANVDYMIINLKRYVYEKFMLQTKTKVCLECLLSILIDKKVTYITKIWVWSFKPWRDSWSYIT